MTDPELQAAMQVFTDPVWSIEQSRLSGRHNDVF
jgi:hypothetical protein